MSMEQFINARMYAKKMVEFLRRRQRDKVNKMKESIKTDILNRLKENNFNDIEKKFN